MQCVNSSMEAGGGGGDTEGGGGVMVRRDDDTQLLFRSDRSGLTLVTLSKYLPPVDGL